MDFKVLEKHRYVFPSKYMCKSIKKNIKFCFKKIRVLQVAHKLHLCLLPVWLFSSTDLSSSLFSLTFCRLLILSFLNFKRYISYV